MRCSKVLCAWLSILVALIVLTASIAVPILCRPFYCAHIEPMNLPELTGLTHEEIKTAFDEMMDYCLGGKIFSTGVLVWSENGKSYFDDVRALFLLDLYLLLGTTFILIATLIVSRLCGRQPGRLLGRSCSFWAGAGLCGIFVIIGALAAIDFDRAFVVFHSLFFPGKDNWIFAPSTDAIITILPQDFFMHCAILILLILILSCMVLILWDLLFHRKNSSRKF